MFTWPAFSFCDALDALREQRVVLRLSEGRLIVEWNGLVPTAEVEAWVHEQTPKIIAALEAEQKSGRHVWSQRPPEAPPGHICGIPQISPEPGHISQICEMSPEHDLAAALVAQLTALGCSVSLEGDRVKVSPRPSDPALVERLIASKGLLVKYLGTRR